MGYLCTILLPVYNEETSVRPVIESIQKELSSFEGANEILVVDDGSTDDTRECLAAIEGIRVITHEKNRGYGAAVKTGVANAKGERVLLMDADASYPADRIRRMIRMVQTCDMVVGARQSPFIPQQVMRGLLRYLFKVAASVLLWTWIPDLNSGMRIFKTEIARHYLAFLPDGFSASSTLTAIFIRKGHSIRYIDIPYRTRTGISKLNVVLDGLRFFRYVLFGLSRTD